MDCWNLKCRLKAEDLIECSHCQLRTYCSEKCLKEDWDSVHSSQCKSNSLDLSDFFPIQSHPFLGRGTYGEVKLIKNKKTGQLLALKRIKKKTTNPKSQMKILSREIQLQLGLSHRNITSLYDYKETSSDMLLFLEYIDGGNLFTKLKKKTKFREREACKYFFQVCSGIQYLHENKIIHRDIKPENILISKSGNVKICDFGWAVATSENRKTYCGTLEYMAPEVLAGLGYSRKVDIWSLGVLLYELLQGQMPFTGKTPAERLSKIKENRICFIIDISKAAKALIMKMLSTDPESRPDINDILADDWVLRYSSTSPGTNDSVKSCGFEDEFEVKLSRNYPSSYKRKLFSNQLSTTVLSQIENKDCSGSNSNTNVGESENLACSFALKERKRKEDELIRLQMKLEGRKNDPEKKVFFSPICSIFSLRSTNYLNNINT